MQGVCSQFLHELKFTLFFHSSISHEGMSRARKTHRCFGSFLICRIMSEKNRSDIFDATFQIFWSVKRKGDNEGVPRRCVIFLVVLNNSTLSLFVSTLAGHHRFKKKKIYLSRKRHDLINLLGVCFIPKSVSLPDANILKYLLLKMAYILFEPVAVAGKIRSQVATCPVGGFFIFSSFFHPPSSSLARLL